MKASLDYELNNCMKHLDLKTETEYCIGRDPECPVCLGDHPNVSRRHCLIYFNTTINSFALTDLYSTAGTELNGRKIGHRDVPLHDGDMISVSGILFEFHCDPPDDSKPVRTETTRISMISRAKPFAPGDRQTDERRFRFHKDELFQGNEKILEHLPSAGGKELYLTSAKNGTVHFLKIRNDLPQDGQAGRELRRHAGKIPNLTGLIPIRSCGPLDDGACFILSDYQDVPSYAKMISMLSPLPQSSALALIYSAILILARAWQNNLFHGYLKPAKILYSPKDGNYITEMGLSGWREKYFPDLVNRSGQWYAAPETTAGKSVWQSDQYALGIMLFQMLTGVLPFRSDSPSELAAMHRDQTMPLPQERNGQVRTIPAVDAVILRMTMKDPSERYSSWEKLLADLEKANSALKSCEKSLHNTL